MKNHFYTNLGYDIDINYNYSTLAYVQLFAIAVYSLAKIVNAAIILRRKNLSEEIKYCKDFKIK